MGIICTICGEPLEMKLVDNIASKGKVYDIYFCGRCKVGSTVLLPTAEELSRLYAFGRYRTSSGTRFNRVVEAFIYLFRAMRRTRIERYVKRGRILDIGCGRGLFLAIMRKAGWSVAGVEFDRETASAAAEKYGIPVLSGDSHKWAAAGKDFDVITIHHVLEHVRDPAGMIRTCRSLLRRGGMLTIAVPNIRSLQASAGKRVWFHLDIPYHLYHFSEEGLLDLLRNNSFAVMKVRRFDLEFGPFGWLQTLLNLSGINENFFYNLLKQPELRKQELPHSIMGDLLLTFVLLPFYLPLSVLLSVVESLIFKRGGTIEIYAVKEQ